MAEDVEVDVPYYLDGTSTAPVVYDDRSYSKTWTSTLSKERVPNGFVKKGNGTLTLSAKPTYTSSTTVEAGTLVMPSGTTVADAVITGGTLQIAQGSTITKLAMTGGKIEVPIVGQVSDTTILTITELADGTTLTTDNFTYPASVTLTLDTTTTPGAVLVKASRSVQNYVWTPTSGTAFETLGNWRVNGEVPIEAPYPTIDTIEFPAEGAPWTVALADDATVASVAVNGAVTLTGAKLLANAFTGTAAITLDGNAGIGDFEPTADITISNPIVVSGTGNSINSNVKSVTVSGAISGGGVLSLLGANGNAVVILTGNNSAFEGTMYMDNSTCATLASDTAGSAKAKWVLNNSSTRNPVTGPKRGAYTVHFGELSGTYNHVAASGNEFYNILYVGALGSDFALGGSLAPASNFDRSETLHKVGDGTMTLSATRAKNLYCDGGVLYLTVAPLVYSEGAVSFNGGTLRLNALAAAEDLSGKVKNSTSAISVDIDSGVNAAWGSAIANSNTAGLTKKGDGTLTLDAAPEYTGKTKVEAGALYIIDGEYTLDLDPGTAEVTTDKDGYRKFVPASVAISGMVFLLF